MIQESYKTAVFSGRFDPFHIGHLATILTLAKTYGRVAVIILDYPGREACSVHEARNIINNLLELISPPISRKTVEVFINDIHFAKITYSEYATLLRNIGVCSNHAIYVSGNREVLKNMETEGIKACYVPRTDDYLYTGTKIRHEMRESYRKDCICQPIITEVAGIGREAVLRNPNCPIHRA